MHPCRMLMSLVLALAVLFVVPATSAAATPANVPTWQVGQAVGYGTSVNLGKIAQSYISQLWASANASGATVNALRLTGSLDAWFHDEVTGATSSLYTLSQSSASGVKVHFEYNLTIPNEPNPGVYPGNTSLGYCQLPNNIPTSSRTTALTIDWTSLENGTSMARYRVSDLATTKQVANTTIRASSSVKAYNLPFPDINYTACKETISYKSETLSLTANSQDQVRTTYGPALDSFNFPISDGKVWSASSNATIGATVAGTINVQGLSAQDQQSFFQNLSVALRSIPGISVSGLDGFPIDLSKITVTEGLNNILKDGVLQDQTVPLNESLRATAGTKTLSDGQQHAVYQIGPAYYVCPLSGGSLPYTIEAIYAPDFPAANAGMIVGYQGLYCVMGVSTAFVSLDNVPASQANANIQQTQTNYNPFPSAPSNTIVDFFAASPFYGLWIIVVVVAVAAAFALMRRRRRPAMAPPPQVQQSPPETPPPTGP